MSKSKLTTKRLEEWASLPTILKDQINDNKDYFLEEYDKGKLTKILKSWTKDLVEIKYRKKYSNSDELNYFAVQSLIFTHVSALHAAQSERFRRIQCYDEMGNGIIQLEKHIANGERVVLIEGRFTHPKYRPHGYNSDRVVVKLYQKNRKDNTQYEINQYRELKDPEPSLGINCWFWNIPVLVMRPMEKIGRRDNEIEVGRQILKQMSKIHAWKPHSDIKPLNIMKIPIPLDHHNQQQQKPVYTLIDFGGCPKERKSDGIGWRRRTWSSKWTDGRQGDRITPKQDLFELGTTLNTLRYCREKDLNKHPDEIYKIPYSSLWREYMKYVNSIDEFNTTDYSEHYKNLIDILNSYQKSRSLSLFSSSRMSDRDDKEKDKYKDNRTKNKDKDNNNDKDNNYHTMNIGKASFPRAIIIQ
jgi:hypothetical protein